MRRIPPRERALRYSAALAAYSAAALPLHCKPMPTMSPPFSSAGAPAPLTLDELARLERRLPVVREWLASEHHNPLSLPRTSRIHDPLFTPAIDRMLAD